MRGLYEHTPTGTLVFLTNGEYQVNGRISNFYSGNILNENSELTNEILGDYNTYHVWLKIKDYKVKIELNNQNK